MLGSDWERLVQLCFENVCWEGFVHGTSTAGPSDAAEGAPPPAKRAATTARWRDLHGSLLERQRMDEEQRAAGAVLASHECETASERRTNTYPNPPKEVDPVCLYHTGRIGAQRCAGMAGMAAAEREQLSAAIASLAAKLAR